MYGHLGKKEAPFYKNDQVKLIPYISNMHNMHKYRL